MLVAILIPCMALSLSLGLELEAVTKHTVQKRQLDWNRQLDDMPFDHIAMSSSRSEDQQENDDQRGSRSTGLPGEPGIDYPVLPSIPLTDFHCRGRVPGYYGDTQTACQVFHVCDMSGRQDSFLCPNGTIFSQKVLACDYWYNVQCSATKRHYRLNRNLFKGSDINLYGTPSFWNWLSEMEVNPHATEEPPIAVRETRQRQQSARYGKSVRYEPESDPETTTEVSGQLLEHFEWLEEESAPDNVAPQLSWVDLSPVGPTKNKLQQQPAKLQEQPRKVAQKPKKLAVSAYVDPTTISPPVKVAIKTAKTATTARPVYNNNLKHQIYHEVQPYVTDIDPHHHHTTTAKPVRSQSAISRERPILAHKPTTTTPRPYVPSVQQQLYRDDQDISYYYNYLTSTGKPLGTKTVKPVASIKPTTATATTTGRAKVPSVQQPVYRDDPDATYYYDFFTTVSSSGAKQPVKPPSPVKKAVEGTIKPLPLIRVKPSVPVALIRPATATPVKAVREAQVAVKPIGFLPPSRPSMLRVSNPIFRPSALIKINPVSSKTKRSEKEELQYDPRLDRTYSYQHPIYQIQNWESTKV